MISSVLKKEVEELKSQGKSTENIKLELIKAGWPKKTVEDAFAINEVALSPVAVTTPQVVTTSQTTPSAYSGEAQIKNTQGYFLNILSGEKKFRVFLAGLIIGLISCIYPSYKAIKFGLPLVKNIEQRVIAIVDEVFPDEVEITIEKGKAKTNVTEPYHLTISQNTLQNLFSLDENSGQPTSKIRLLTLNTSGKIEDFEKNQSLAMLTSQNLVYYSDEGVQIASLANVPDMKVNKQFIDTKISELNKDQKLTRFFTVIIYLIPILITFGILFLFISEVLVGSFIIWLIARILQTQIRFGKLYGLTGALVSIPYLFLTNIHFVPFLEPFYIWINTALDVVVVSIAYVLISQYKNTQKTI